MAYIFVMSELRVVHQTPHRSYIRITKWVKCICLCLLDQLILIGPTNIEIGVDLYRFVEIDLIGIQILAGDIWIRLGYLHYFGFDSVVPDGVKNPHFEKLSTKSIGINCVGVVDSFKEVKVLGTQFVILPWVECYSSLSY